MKKSSTLNDVFKFSQLHKAKPWRLNTIRLLPTQYLISIRSERSAERKREMARHIVSDSTYLARMDTLAHGALIYCWLTSALAKEEPQLRSFYDEIDSDIHRFIEEATFTHDLERLSDTLLAYRFIPSARPKNIEEIENLFRAYLFLAHYDDYRSLQDYALLELLSAPVLMPASTGSPAALITSVGVADLLVVKQHILRYEETEIAHIENVMATESRSRTHRFLERFEETVTLERELTDTREYELETSERFELNKEASKTIKEDQKYGFDLSVSGKYGPTFEFRSGFELDITSSSESSAKSASHYAKNITDRSLERIEERVREERIRKIVRESEENNTHSFTNESGDHIVGIYQFVDKIYEAQVFNYGKRQMFDLMVPEPASYLWHLMKNPPVDERRPSIPPEPQPLRLSPQDLSYSNERPLPVGKVYYMDLVQRYGATSVTPPKPQYTTATARLQQPENSGETNGVTEGGTPRTARNLEIAIPNGYVPRSANLNIISLTDKIEDLKIPFFFENERGYWDNTSTNKRVLRSNGPYYFVLGNEEITFSNMEILPTGNKLSVSMLFFESANYTVNAQVHCELSDTELQNWQLTVYAEILTAYRERLDEWRSEVSEIEAQVKAQTANDDRRIGIPPGKRQQTIVTELKKHCSSILTRQWYDRPSSLRAVGTAPPTFDLVVAQAYGSFTRFIEQSFEWHQIQFAFYPYYWSDKNNWHEKFEVDNPDYNFQQFLQAGFARVLVPVRPGFEVAVNHYLETGEIWEGRGEPPTIEDETYVSIIDEIKEQSGEELDEPIPVGEPWEIRLPTNLVKLKRTADLPRWQRDPDELWSWRPASDTDA